MEKMETTLNSFLHFRFVIENIYGQGGPYEDCQVRKNQFTAINRLIGTSRIAEFRCER